MIEQVTQEWRDCQRRVNALERQYADAMTAYCRGEGPEPPDDLHAQLVKLRAEAHRLLTVALREIDERMQEQERKLGGA